MNDDEEEEEEEEWDADLLDHLIQVEERARSSYTSSSSSFPNPNPNPLHTANFPSCISYSPPRELSQRPVRVDSKNNKFDTLLKPHGVSSSLPPVPRPLDDVKDREIQRLKSELGHASEQLLNLERECFELRNERNKKEKLKCVSSNTTEKDVGAHCLNNINLRHVPAPKKHEVHEQSRNTNAIDNEIPHQINLASSSKAIGIQTDKTDGTSNLGLKDGLPSHPNVSTKLLGIWSSSSDHKSGRDLISKLYTACDEDFHFLLGRMGLKISEMSGASLNHKDSSIADPQGQSHSLNSSESEAAKISYLYSVLNEIGNGLLRLESLIAPLVELCYLENVDILCSSLTILRVFLKHLLSSGTRFEERDNVKIEGATSHNKFEARSLLGTKSSFDRQTFPNNDIQKIGTGLPSSVNWVTLFNFFNSIALNKTEARARLEAVSIMNLILLRTDAFQEREMFGQAPVFESIAQFLKKEAGSHVQKETLQLLYSLLNCPRLLIVFCSGCKGENNAKNDPNGASTSNCFRSILEGLAGCLGGRENNLQDIELRKKAVIVVAFLASSGNSGFEILVNHKLSGGEGFVMLILQLLIWEMDVEESVSLEPAGSIKARTLLMRETLILLNRIVSSQNYSAIVLRILTGSRDMACMSIDIVTRLSREDQLLRRPSDNITLQMRGTEIIDLARQLKKRVFTYLGDRIT